MLGSFSRKLPVLPCTFLRRSWIGSLVMAMGLVVLAGCGPSDREIDATVEARIASRETRIHQHNPLKSN